MVRCSECGEEFRHIGNHWAYNNSHRPEITNEQKEIIDGCMMGDASLYTQNKNPYIRVINTSKEYLSYLDRKFGVLSTGVTLHMSAKEKAAADRESNFNPSAVEENYNDLYYLQTRGHPFYNKYKDWYSSGDKLFPKELKLTKKKLKHWYICDGHIRTNRENQIKISCVNESDNIEKLKNIFERSKFPVFDRVENSDSSHFSMAWNKDSANKLISMIGGPVNGYEYKWP